MQSRLQLQHPYCDTMCQEARPLTIVFNTWHKSGTWWSSQAFKTISHECHLRSLAITSDDVLHATGLCAARRSHEGLSGVIIHLNSASYIKLHVPIRCLASLPPKRSRFVHFIREPFALVASFFLFHLSGQECGYADMRSLCDELRFGWITASQLPSSDRMPPLMPALKASADFALARPLPRMAMLHEELASLPHVHTVRLESLALDYDGTAAALLAFLGFPRGGALHRSLLKKLQVHDTSRWHADQLQASPHVNPGRGFGISAEQVGQALRQSVPHGALLGNLSLSLGYAQRGAGR